MVLAFLGYYVTKLVRAKGETLCYGSIRAFGDGLADEQPVFKGSNE